MGHQHHIQKQFETRISEAFRDLLENKHFYQSLTVDPGEFKKNVILGVARRLAEDTGHPTVSWTEALVEAFGTLERSVWEFDSTEDRLEALLKTMTQKDIILIRISLPTIKIPCNHCDSIRPPHNHGYIGKSTQKNSHIFQEDSEVVQLFEASYQCQSCKGEPIVFLIHRKGLKLTLVGRSQFPQVAVPDSIPENIKKFYRNAIIADRTSFTLAAALYLRTVIEQHFYKVVPDSEIKAIKGNPTGDELAELYAKTLPKNFPGNFPSLKKAYDDLSEIVHSGKEDEKAKQRFETIRTSVEQHFEAVHLFNKISTK